MIRVMLTFYSKKAKKKHIELEGIDLNLNVVPRKHESIKLSLKMLKEEDSSFAIIYEGVKDEYPIDFTVIDVCHALFVVDDDWGHAIILTVQDSDEFFEDQ